MCCERIQLTVMDTANALPSGDFEKLDLVRLAADLAMACPRYGRTHTSIILYPSNLQPIDLFDAVVNSGGDDFVQLVIRHNLLFPDSKIPAIASAARQSETHLNPL